MRSVVVTVVLCVAVIGCGQNHEVAPAPTTPTASPAAAPTAAPKPSRTRKRPKPSSPPYAGNYDEARIVCSLSPLSAIAADFSLPADASAERVARRYARGYFPAARREASYAGCLAGIRSR
jgi:hypothetical protein